MRVYGLLERICSFGRREGERDEGPAVLKAVDEEVANMAAKVLAPGFFPAR